MGEKGFRHGKKVQLVGEMTLNGLKQLRRKEEDPETAQDERHQQIAKGLPQFVDKNEKFWMRGH